MNLAVNHVRICGRCFEEKPATVEFFPASKRSRGGINTYCRVCCNILTRDWKRRNHARLADERREAYRNEYGEQHRELERLRGDKFPVRYTAEILRSSARERARKRLLPIAKELRRKDFIIGWLEKQPNCACCDVPFSFGRKRADGPKNSSATFDQIIPSKGYNLDNVALICWRCNNIKRNYSASDLRLVADWIDQITETGVEQPSAPAEPVPASPSPDAPAGAGSPIPELKRGAA